MIWPAALLLLQLVSPTTRIAGIVVDATGAPVGGARVTVSSGEQTVGRTVTADDGRFELGVTIRGPLMIVVAAPGFVDEARTVAADALSSLRVTLMPRGIVETVIVAGSSSAARLTTPASTTVLDRETLTSSAALSLDDQLRAVPGFSLFRRSSSRVANPTVQGVTLRGLAASGASRTLVLADGLPLNDPFGGWVYWHVVPAAAIERVEVVRGGSSDLYGSDALGGAIRIESARTGARALLDGGSDRTARLSAVAGRAFESWSVFAAVEKFTTDGFVIVAPEARGPIDTRASSEHVSIYSGVSVPVAESHVRVRAAYFSEDRGNGTPFQANATISRQLAGVGMGSLWGGFWTARAYAANQDYDQTFSAVAADRRTERPTTVQHVDCTSGGGWFDWLRAGRVNALLLSASARQIDADLLEGPVTAIAAGLPPERTSARQRTTAMVMQFSSMPFGNLTIAAGARAELWQSGRRDQRLDRVGFLAPRGSVVWRVNDALSLRTAFQTGYRSPTINELFRSFRVGNVVTQANPALGPEESWGFEGAAFVKRGRTAARVTAFWTRLNDAIVNVTLASDATAILRERQNAGRIRVAGVELETDVRIAPFLSFVASGAAMRSTFTEGIELDGLRVPQVPQWQASAALHGGWSRLSASLDWRAVGRQFDDDRNQFALGASSMTNARIGWRVRRAVELFAAVENAFDEEQDVGRTPIRTIGLPRTVRGGVRFGFR
jgi:outer membrane receptor protein involved in Fe transport